MFLLVLVSQTVQKKLDKAEEELKHAKTQACEASKERDALKACASALVVNIAARPRYAACRHALTGAGGSSAAKARRESPP